MIQLRKHTGKRKPTGYPIGILLGLLGLLSAGTRAQPFVTLPRQLNQPRFADWVTHPGIQGKEYGVYYFRKTFSVNQVPDTWPIHVSADNRYKLFVNGQPVGQGPAVGDLNNWQYETYDIAPWLQPGKNVLAAQVWNMGPYRGARQVTAQTAFIVQGGHAQARVCQTNSSWQVARDSGYYPVSHTARQVGGGYIVGATDSLLAARHPWGWQKLHFRSAHWPQAVALGKGNHQGLNTWLGTPWLLRARKIPPMEQRIERFPRLLQAREMALPPTDYSDSLHFTVPPHSRVTLLLDNQQLTMGYPELVLSGGKKATVKIHYQEALFDSLNRKGHRDQWAGKTMKGYYDVYVSDGGPRRLFTPLWLRVFRYVQLTITTHEQPLQVHDFYNRFTAYPMQQRARFSADDESIQPLWQAAWRTARLCALETFMDCPYYEQVQYIGDTRIQALIALYVTGDARLVKNAIHQFYQSMQPMGLTKSAHPQHGVQIIPPFSLLYISMVYDYFMLRNDSAFIQQYLPGIRFILDWFVPKISENGLLGPVPYWNHVDGGTPEFTAGSPPGVTAGGSAHLTVLLAYSMQHAANMFRYFGHSCDADKYARLASQLLAAVRTHCYQPSTGLIAETPHMQLFSQHTNAMAILAGLFSAQEARQAAWQLTTNESLAQGTLYFQFYVFLALRQAGRGELLLPQLERWHTFLDKGLTTFPEHGLESRSDCHAWSAHPLYHLLHTTCGVASGAPGFRFVRITPQPGTLNQLHGSVVHPLGMIETHYQRQPNGTLQATIELPEGLTGELEWKGTLYPLNSEKNTLKLP